MKGSDSENSKNRSNDESHHKNTGWPDVAIKSLDIIYELFRTGNIVALIVFSIIALIFVILLRIPEENIPWLLSSVAAFLRSSYYSIFLLVGILAFCAFSMRIVNKVHKREIQRLVDVRKRLIHGRRSGKLKPLEKHTSTGFRLGDDDHERE